MTDVGNMFAVNELLKFVLSVWHNAQPNIPVYMKKHDVKDSSVKIDQ